MAPQAVGMESIIQVAPMLVQEEEEAGGKGASLKARIGLKYFCNIFVFFWSPVPPPAKQGFFFSCQLFSGLCTFYLKCVLMYFLLEEKECSHLSGQKFRKNTLEIKL